MGRTPQKIMRGVRTQMANNSIIFNLDSSCFNEQLSMLKAELVNSSEEILCKVRKLLLDTPDFLEKLFRLKIDDGSTRASKVLVSLDPTDCFRMLLAAIRTGDFDSLIVEN